MTVEVTEQALRLALQNAASITEAAIMLRVSRRTMYRLIARYGVEIKRRVA